MLTFSCGVCAATLKTPPEQAGKLVRCPKCQTTLRVPDAAPAAASSGMATVGSTAGAVAGASESARPPAPAPSDLRGAARPMGGRRYGFNCQYCSSRLETTESQAGQEGSCPTCGNAIIIPILDRYGRLIDPMTGKVIKQDPHPVHAYAAAGERAPRIIRQANGVQAIDCPKCHSISSITVNNCKNCGMPFTMEGTTVEASGARNGFAVASLVLGIIGIPTCMIVVVPALGLVFGVIGYAQTRGDSGGAGKGLAIAGIAVSCIALAISGMYWMGLLR